MLPNSARPITQEVPTLDFLALEAQKLAAYVFQEGEAKEQKDLIKAMDFEKLLAWLEVSRKDPARIFLEAVKVIQQDARAQIANAVDSLVSENPNLFTLEEYREARGQTKEAVVIEGREVAAKALRRALSRTLRQEERDFVGDMAHLNPDERIIELGFSSAERDGSIALELAYNPYLDPVQVNRLVNLAFGKGSELESRIEKLKAERESLHDEKAIEKNEEEIEKAIRDKAAYESVVIELVASPENHARLSQESLDKIRSNPMTKGCLDVWDHSGNADSKGIGLPRSEKKQAKTSEERRRERRAMSAERQDQLRLLDEQRSTELENHIQDSSQSPQRMLELARDPNLGEGHVRLIAGKAIEKLKGPERVLWLSVVANLIDGHHEQMDEETKELLRMDPEVKGYLEVFEANLEKKTRGTRKTPPESLGDARMFMRR
jgi:hypothetical protein